jgi:transposase-like protein
LTRSWESSASDSRHASGSETESPEAVLGENGLIAQLKKRVVERALAGELTHNLGYAKGEASAEVENHRNGYSRKTVIGEEGAMEIEVPRDRSGSFEPLLIAKGQKRFEGFDEKIIAMYARGMTVREIQGFLIDQYKVEVSGGRTRRRSDTAGPKA